MFSDNLNGNIETVGLVYEFEHEERANKEIWRVNRFSNNCSIDKTRSENQNDRCELNVNAFQKHRRRKSSYYFIVNFTSVNCVGFEKGRSQFDHWQRTSFVCSTNGGRIFEQKTTSIRVEKQSRKFCLFEVREMLSIVLIVLRFVEHSIVELNFRWSVKTRVVVFLFLRSTRTTASKDENLFQTITNFLFVFRQI